MQTPYRLAQAFEMAVVSDVVELTVGDGKAVAEREIGGGAREAVEMPMPCVIGATRGLNEPRYPKLPDIMKAKKKEIKQIELADLGLDLASALTEIVNLEAVPERGQARILDGATRESVEQLVRILKEEEKVI
jgi:electron transfer flavoprotein beta subunit